MSIAFTSLSPAEPPPLRSGEFDILVLRSKLKGADLITTSCIALVAFSTRRSDRLQLQRMVGEFDELSARLLQCTPARACEILFADEDECSQVILALPDDVRILREEVDRFVDLLARTRPGIQLIGVVSSERGWALSSVEHVLKTSDDGVIRSARAALHAMAACSLAPYRIWDHDLPSPMTLSPFGTWLNPAVLIQAVWRPDTRDLIWRDPQDAARLSGFSHVQLYVEAAQPPITLAKDLCQLLLESKVSNPHAGWWFEIAPGMLLSSTGPEWIWPVWMICRL